MKNFDNLIFEKFKEISKRLFLLQKEVITLLKINSSEYKIISTLSLHGDLTQTTLGEACGIDKPATSRLLLKLHLQGLVSKNYKDGNRKAVYINLTEKGKLKAKKISDKIHDLKANYFKELNEEDTSIFVSLLDKALSITEVANA